MPIKKVAQRKTKRTTAVRATADGAQARSFSHEVILDEAMKLIEAEGLDAFTMRGLGRALGIKAMSIYYYFENREALLDSIVEVIMRQIGREAARNRAEEEAWTDVARRLVSAYRTVGTAHAESFQLLATRPLRTKGAVAQGKELMDAFSSAGLEFEEAVIAYRTIACFSVGFILIETADFKPAFHFGNFDREFAGGIDVILAGVQAELIRAQSSSRSARR